MDNKITATFFMGTKSHTTDAPQFDASLPDAELFETVAFQMAVKWASTNGVPHHLPSMRERGCVKRSDKGWVLIQANGWNVRLDSPEYQKAQAEAIAACNWHALSAMCIHTTAWYLEE